MDVATTLRTARHHANLSLDALAARTKIPPGVLRALEQGAFDAVPGGIFIRGYLRAYAREAGLDGEALVAQYLAETAPPLPETVTHVDGDAAQDELSLHESPDLSELSDTGRGTWGYGLIAAALLIALFSYQRGGVDEAQAVAPDPAAMTGESLLLDADVRPVLLEPPTQPASMTDVPVATTGVSLRFDMTAQAPCWVEAEVDGERVVYRLMQPGERATFDPQHELVLRVGDPGAVAYSVNGEPGEPLGPAGRPVTVRLTSDGLSS